MHLSVLTVITRWVREIDSERCFLFFASLVLPHVYFVVKEAEQVVIEVQVWQMALIVNIELKLININIYDPNQTTICKYSSLLPNSTFQNCIF